MGAINDGGNTPDWLPIAVRDEGNNLPVLL